MTMSTARKETEWDLGHQALPKTFVRILREHEFQPVGLLDLLITEDCNCRCDYCFIENKHSETMSEEVLRASVNFLILRSRERREPHLVFFGGEPLLAFDLVMLGVEYGNYEALRAGKRLTYALTTNGTLFDDEKLRLCRDYGIRFLLSIDGDEGTHDAHRRFKGGGGTYRAVVKKVPLMKSYQPWLGARITPTPQNMHKLADNVKHLHELGINQFIIGPATGLHYSDEVALEYRLQFQRVGDYYIEQRRRKAPFRMTDFEATPDNMPGAYRNLWGCGAGGGRLSISASGEIQTCAKIQGLRGLTGIPEFSLGNVLTGFTNLGARRDFTSSRYDLREPCHDCDMKDDCAGGCPAVNYKATGSIFLPDPSACRMGRVQIEVQREIMARLEAEGLDGSVTTEPDAVRR